MDIKPGKKGQHFLKNASVRSEELQIGFAAEELEKE